MTAENAVPQDEEAKVNLALQVANVAAQVSAALQSGDRRRCDELGAKLTLARERLEERGSPSGLLAFLDVMRGLLDGQDVSTDAAKLPASYRAVYEQIVEDSRAGGTDAELTAGEVLDEVVHNVILAMQRGSFEHRRKMADTLMVMEQECGRRPDLVALTDFLTASRILLKGGDPSAVEERLVDPYVGRWQEILGTIAE